MLRTSKCSLANGTLVVASHGEERDEEENDGELIGRLFNAPFSLSKGLVKTSFSHAP